MPEVLLDSCANSKKKNEPPFKLALLVKCNQETLFSSFRSFFFNCKLIQGYQFPSASPTSLELLLIYFDEKYNISLN